MSLNPSYDFSFPKAFLLLNWWLSMIICHLDFHICFYQFYQPLSKIWLDPLISNQLIWRLPPLSVSASFFKDFIKTILVFASLHFCMLFLNIISVLSSCLATIISCTWSFRGKLLEVLTRTSKWLSMHCQSYLVVSNFSFQSRLTLIQIFAL